MNKEEAELTPHEKELMFFGYWPKLVHSLRVRMKILEGELDCAKRSGRMSKSNNYKNDNQEAKAQVYHNPFGPNPYPENTRLHRLWDKWKKHYDYMESVFMEFTED